MSKLLTLSKFLFGMAGFACLWIFHQIFKRIEVLVGIGIVWMLVGSSHSILRGNVDMANWFLLMAIFLTLALGLLVKKESSHG